MEYFTDPNSYDGNSDSQRIQAAIDDAVLLGVSKTVIPSRNNFKSSNVWDIDETIFIPSDFHLVLDNCCLRMADNTFCVMFSNKGAQKNIVIEGVGNACLDGGKYNDLCESNSQKDGRPHISVNSLILFAHVKGFRIEKLTMKNQRWWANNFLYCSDGYIGNIHFEADCSHIENGQIIQGIPEGTPYESIYVKNSDGIDLRTGCHDIIIENISGFTEDDTIAITNLSGSPEKIFESEERSNDIYNITVRNIMSSTICANVRLLNQADEGKMFNILIDGVTDTSFGKKELSRGGYTVRIGDNQLYGKENKDPDRTFGIVARNIFSRAKIGVSVAGALRDSEICNIHMSENMPAVQKDGAILVNVKIDN